MLPLTRLKTRLHLSPPADHIQAKRSVLLAFAFSVLFLSFYVVKNVSRVPIHDEYSSVLYLFSEPPVPIERYWEQHNEHRIPLPRILYLAAVRVAGNDFRAPPILNVLLLVGAVAFFLHAIKKLRGELVLADAALPLGLLTIGQHGNLLWGFQVQFVASTALVLVALSLVLAPGIGQSPRRISGLGLCGVLLIGCGANGVAFAPGIALALLFVGITNRSTRIVSVFWSAAVLAVCIAYFHNLQQPPHHQHAHGSLADTAIGAVNLLGASFGPVVRWLPPQPHDGVTVLGVVSLGLVAATAILLLRCIRDPDRRTQAVAIGGVLVGFLGLAAGIAKGRAGLSNVLDANRYVSLMLPMLAGVYGTWVAFGFVSLPRLIAVTIVLLAIPNAIIGWKEAKPFTYFPKQIEFEVRDGLPLEFIADRNVGLYRGEPRHRREFLELLRMRGVVPFRDAAPMPMLREEEVPVRITRVENAIELEGGFRTTAEIGHAVFALPRRQRIYGFRLTYSAVAGSNEVLPNVMSWERDGTPPASAAAGVINQLEPLANPTETLIWVQSEADSLRIDLFGKDARIVAHKLVILTRPE